MSTAATQPDAQNNSDEDVWISGTDLASSVVASPSGVFSVFSQRAPECVAPSGYCHFAPSTIIQATPVVDVSGGQMSASFVIVQRPKKTEMNRAGRMIQVLPGPNGEGIRQEYYQKNPVVLFNHGFDGFSLPIGISEDKSGKYTVKASKSQLTGTAFFSQSSLLAESIFRLIDEKILRMCSIGFNPEKLIELELEKQALPQGVFSVKGSYGIDVVQSEMVEWSITPIGADREALRQCLETGKVKGKHYLPTLTPFFQTWAADRQAWSPGIGDGTRGQATQVQGNQSASTDLSGIKDAIKSIQSTVGTLAAGFNAILQREQQQRESQTFATQLAETFKQNLPKRLTQNTVVFTPAVSGTDSNPLAELQSVLADKLPALVSSAVFTALAPAQEALQDVGLKLVQMTGKLPD